MGILKKKTSHFTHKIATRLTRLMFDREEPPSHRNITFIINGWCENNMLSVELEIESIREGTTVSIDHLPDVKLLVLGSFGARSF